MRRPPRNCGRHPGPAAPGRGLVKAPRARSIEVDGVAKKGPRREPADQLMAMHILGERAVFMHLDRRPAGLSQQHADRS